MNNLRNSQKLFHFFVIQKIKRYKKYIKVVKKIVHPLEIDKKAIKYTRYLTETIYRLRIEH